MDTGIVVWHCNVEEKENEISALKPLLIPSLVKGRIFTLDAMHTQRALCAQIHRLAGDYVLIAKDNQPTLHLDIADLFEDRTPDRRRWKQAEAWDKGHGRLEHRQIICSPDLNDWFCKQWEGTRQVFRLERTVRLLTTGKLRHEVVYRREPPGDAARPSPTHAASHQRSLGHRKSAPLEAGCHPGRRRLPDAHRSCSWPARSVE